MRIYLDASPVIYIVERVVQDFDYLEMRLFVPGDTLVASELTRLETRVKPIREDDHVLLAQFEAFFAQTVDEMVLLTREVMEMATLIRARYGFATPDTIHLGAALSSECDVFLTNDNRVAKFLEMSVEVVGEGLE